MNRPKKSAAKTSKPVNKVGEKKPLNNREDPLARDSRGKATRQDVRRVAPPTNAPRATNRGK